MKIMFKCDNCFWSRSFEKSYHKSFNWVSAYEESFGWSYEQNKSCNWSLGIIGFYGF